MKVSIDTVLEKFEVDYDYIIDQCNYDTLKAEIELCNDKYTLEFTAFFKHEEYEEFRDEYGSKMAGETHLIEAYDAALILHDEEGTYRQIEIVL